MANRNSPLEPLRTLEHSGITPGVISRILTDKISATYVDVQDLSGGCGQMLTATVVSPEFTKKGVLARHRLVNGALKEEIAQVHAWTVKCYTVEEWAARDGGA